MSFSIRIHARKLIGITALLLLLLGAAMQPVFAAGDYVVSKTADTNDGTCDADCSLREAITAANADGIASAITFSASANGTITLGSALPNLANNGTLTITGNGAANTIISGNNAVGVFQVAAGANVTISGVTVTGGRASNGGGILNDMGTLTVSNSTISGNSATTNGGGILNDMGTLTVSNSTISGNSATGIGGGILNGGTMTVSNSTISGNTANNTGGGIFSVGTLTVSNSTISGNSAGSGGGIRRFSGTLTLNNSIIANSTSGGDCVRAGDVGTVNAQNSLIEGGLGCVNGTNTANLTGDPALNGDLTLSSTSIAINAGNNSLIPVGVTTDLAGNARIAQTTVDMGAYESSFVPIPVVTISATDASGAEAGSDAITFTVSRSGASTTDALSVDYTIGGDAVNGTDYTPTLSGTVEVPAGQSAVGITITPTDDALDESDETVTLTLSATAAYTLGATTSDSGTIIDNDAAGVTVSPLSFSVSEGDSGSYQIGLLTPPSDSSVVTLLVSFDATQLSVNGSSAPFLLSFSDTTLQTVPFTVLSNTSLAETRTISITHSVSTSSAPEYPLALSRALSVTINEIAPVATYPPPPPVPLCEDHNFEEGGVVRSSTSDALGYAINCRVLYQNGSPTTWFGADLYSSGNLGVPGLIELGVQQAIDIFSPLGMTRFEGGAVFCLRGSGSLIWLAASGIPRRAEIIGSYTVPDFPGFTCVTLFEPGTLVLVSRNPLGG